MQRDKGRDVTRYNSVCLIGNWSEDRDLQRSLMKEALQRKATGALKIDAYQQKMAVALQDVELTKIADDPYIHFGDVIQLVHVDTGCVMACDVGDKDVRPGEESCSATAAPEIRGACARNSLVLLKYKAPKTTTYEPEYTDDVLHYGQKVRLAAFPAASGQSVDRAGGQKPLCLFSKPVSTTHYAKYSRHQLVGFTYRDTFDTVWQIMTPDPAMRGLSEGVEVVAGAPLLLVHAATQKPLCLESQKVPNDFGMELEVSVWQAVGNGLKLAMEQTSQGIAKGFLPKGELTDNYWTFVSGSTVAALPDPLLNTMAGDRALSDLVTELAAKPGAASLLERKLVTMESTQSLLPQDEFLLALRQVGSTIPESDVQQLVSRFAAVKPGAFIDCRAFRQALRA